GGVDVRLDAAIADPGQVRRRLHQGIGIGRTAGRRRRRRRGRRGGRPGGRRVTGGRRRRGRRPIGNGYLGRFQCATAVPGGEPGRQVSAGLMPADDRVHAVVVQRVVVEGGR